MCDMLCIFKYPNSGMEKKCVKKLFGREREGKGVEERNSINIQFARVEFAAVVKPKGIC